MSLKLFCVLFVEFVLISFSKAYRYRAVATDVDIFSACVDDLNSSVLDVNGLFDFSEFTFDVGETTEVSGNLTFVWDIQPTDRIQFEGVMLHFERGTWQPTILSVKIPDFCTKMYDQENVIYPYFFKHVTNQKDIKNDCFNKGTKVKFEPFNFNKNLDVFLMVEGSYKVEVKITAVDQGNIIRPTSICVDVKIEIFQA